MRYFLNKEELQSLLTKSEIPRLDKILLLLFWDDQNPKKITEIRDLAVSHGLRECKKWNIADVLSRSKGKSASIKEGWILTTTGRDYLIKLGYLTEQTSILKNDIDDLRKHLTSVKNVNTKAFLEEAISCMEINQNRAAVVFSWIGAMALLHDHVIASHLPQFNAEAARRDPKWKDSKTSDDLSRMKEYDMLNVLEAISVIGKNVKQELQNALQLRNGCGHPNSLQIGIRKVAAHIETLILNVYSKF